jgi:NAD(P)H-dependent FMN reductase
MPREETLMAASAPPIHVAILCGSLRGRASCTLRALEIAAAEVRAAGAQADLIELGSLGLPFCEGPDDRPDHPGTMALKQRTKVAQAILLGSPEYHNSFSGVLKNALDLLGSEELRGKLFGLLGVGGGDVGAVNSLGHLRYVVRGVGGWSLPIQVSIPHAHQAFAGDRLRDPKLEERIRTFARELVRFARLHACEPHFEARLADVIDRDPSEEP